MLQITGRAFLLVVFVICLAFSATSAVCNAAVRGSRRFAANLLLTTSSMFILIGGSPVSSSYTAPVAAAHAAQPSGSGLVYKSGKNPVQMDPSDPKVGSKKDTSFLRCMSNCKAKCQLPSEGLAKSDCVVDCQDQCCMTYEQCSFKYKSSTGNTI